MKEIYRQIICSDFVLDGDDLYFPVYGSDELVKASISTGKSEVLCKFSKNPEKEYFNLYNSVEKIANNLVFAPAGAEKIALYNINNKEMSYIDLERFDIDGNEVYDDNSLFWKCIIDGEIIYLLGFYYPSIVRIDMTRMNVSYIREWIKEVNQYIPSGDKRGYIGNGCFIQGREVILPLMCAPALLHLNLDSLTTYVEVLNTKMDGFGCMACDEEFLYLQGKGDSIGKVCKYSIIKREVVVDEVLIEKLNRNDYTTAFSGTVLSGRKWLLFPQEANNLYELNTDTMMTEIPSWASFMDEYKNSTDHWVLCAKLTGKKVIFVTNHDKSWHEYDLNSGEIRHFRVLLPVSYSEKSMEEKIKLNIRKNRILYEKDHDLSGFLRVIQMEPANNKGI